MKIDFKEIVAEGAECIHVPQKMAEFRIFVENKRTFVFHETDDCYLLKINASERRHGLCQLPVII